MSHNKPQLDNFLPINNDDDSIIAGELAFEAYQEQRAPLLNGPIDDKESPITVEQLQITIPNIAEESEKKEKVENRNKMHSAIVEANKKHPNNQNIPTPFELFQAMYGIQNMMRPQPPSEIKGPNLVPQPFQINISTPHQHANGYPTRKICQPNTLLPRPPASEYVQPSTSLSSHNVPNTTSVALPINIDSVVNKVFGQADIPYTPLQINQQTSNRVLATPNSTGTPSNTALSPVNVIPPYPNLPQVPQFNTSLLTKASAPLTKASAPNNEEQKETKKRKRVKTPETSALPMPSQVNFESNNALWLKNADLQRQLKAAQEHLQETSRQQQVEITKLDAEIKAAEEQRQQQQPAFNNSSSKINSNSSTEGVGWQDLVTKTLNKNKRKSMAPPLGVMPSGPTNEKQSKAP